MGAVKRTEAHRKLADVKRRRQWSFGVVARLGEAIATTTAWRGSFTGVGFVGVEEVQNWLSNGGAEAADEVCVCGGGGGGRLAPPHQRKRRRKGSVRFTTWLRMPWKKNMGERLTNGDEFV